MTTGNVQPTHERSSRRHDALKFLRQDQIQMIDEALANLGSFGEVRIIVEKGRLRFLVVQKSIDALKWQPGSTANDIAEL